MCPFPVLAYFELVRVILLGCTFANIALNTLVHTQSSPVNACNESCGGHLLICTLHCTVTVAVRQLLTKNRQPFQQTSGHPYSNSQPHFMPAPLDALRMISQKPMLSHNGLNQYHGWHIARRPHNVHQTNRLNGNAAASRLP